MNGISVAVLVLVIVLIVAMVIFMAPACYSHYMYGRDHFSNVTTLMSGVEDVPSIKLVEKDETMNIFQKLESPSDGRIRFNIKTGDQNYTLEVPDYGDYSFAGKGMVIAASGNRYRYVTGLYTNLYVMRKYHKSSIPVEIFYVGQDEAFTSEIERMLLALGNVKIIDMVSRLNTNLREEELRGYQTKPLAVMCSSFEEVVLMDADALSFMDPYYLFDADGYDSHGMILFKDYVDCLSFISRDFMDTINIGQDRYCNYTGNYEIDSSCVVLNKEKYWEALYVISTVNVKSDKYHKSKNVLGDKDTWLIGCMFLNLEPYVSQPSPYVLITDRGKLIVGHLQSTNFSDTGITKEFFTHYNNQKIILKDANVYNYTYAEVKNPRGGQDTESLTKNYLPNNVKESFDYGKKAMEIIHYKVPEHLRDNVVVVDGISKGLIP